MVHPPPQTEWHMEGNWIKNCSCDPGCPCDFNAAPTHHYCEGMVAMEVVDGQYGDVSLSGTKWAATVHFPGPLHEGHGTLQPFLDDSTTDEQRDALLAIMSGQSGGAMFQIFAAITETVLEPQFVPMEFEFDMDGRTARFTAGDILETESEPIKNPVTGDEHRALVQLPNGFEYELAEIALAPTVKSTGGILFDHQDGHSSLAEVRFSHND
jgi:hypothetical protein